MKSDRDDIDQPLSDCKIESLIESLQHEIYPTSSLRAKIISDIKQFASNQIASRKLCSFAITLLLLISVQPGIKKVSSNWRDATFFQPLRQVEEEVRRSKDGEPDSKNWSAHDTFYLWRKNHIDQFSRIMPELNHETFMITP